MQKVFRKIVFWKLRLLTKFKLRRIKPIVLGITGSYAKTSVRDAIALIVSQKYRVRKNTAGFNTEYGICLDLLNIRATGKVGTKHSVLSWAQIIWKGFVDALISRDNYEVLVLELGLDKPGDMDLILQVIKPNIQVVTGIALNHVEFGFNSQQDVWNEKRKLVDALSSDGTAILNFDDKYIKQVLDEVKCNIITFSDQSTKSDLQVTLLKSDLSGLKAKFNYQDQSCEASFKILGAQHLTVVNAAIATSLALGFSLEEAVQALANFSLPDRRMTKLEGIKQSIILDSTYNASPKTTMAALDLLSELNAKRKIAVIGSMNELGQHKNKQHLAVGRYAAKKADILIAVGHSADYLVNGFSEETDSQYFQFSSADMAADFLKTFVDNGDLLLVKGSHSINMDRVVDSIKI